MRSYFIPSQMIISAKWLSCIFALIFLSALILQLPIRLLGDRMHQYGFNFEHQIGNVWSGQFINAIFAGQVWSKVEISLHKVPLIFGEFEVGFHLENEESRFSGEIKLSEGELMELSLLEGDTEIYAKQNGLRLRAQISINSDSIVVNRKGICSEGTMDVEANLSKLSLSGATLELPILQGHGRCVNEEIRIAMRGSSSDMEITYQGAASNEVNRGIIAVKLQNILESNAAVRNALALNGFRKVDGVWQANLEM